MIVSTRTIVPCLLAAFVFTGTSVLAGELFKDMPFDKALEQAAKDKTIVFIDFYTTWCGPCKMMDSSTFKNGRVMKWLADKTVPLKVDAERNLTLAEKFRIQFYPTLVFVKPNGSELDRVSGYLTPAEFLELAESIEKGETVLGRARRKVEASPDDPAKKIELANALAMRGHYEEAFGLLTWCLDHGTEKAPDFDGDAAIGILAQVAQVYKPAEKELFARRDAAEKRILAGSPVGVDIALYVTVNGFMGENKRTLTTYDKVTASEANRDMVRLMTPHVFPVLLEAKRYEEIARTVDVAAKIEEILREADATSGVPMSDMPAEQAESIRAMMLRSSLYELTSYYQVLLGLGHTEQAARVAESALRLDDGSETYNALAWSGYLTGKPTEENLAQAKRAWELDGKTSIAVLDTLVRVMYARGQTAEAIKMCEKYLAKAETEQDKWLLNTCLTEFREGASG